MAKRYTRKRRHKKQKRVHRRTMKGGAFSQDELEYLQNNGFNQQQIESLEALGVSINEVMQKVNTIMNVEPDGFHGNSDDMTEQVMIELTNEHTFNSQPMDFGEGIPHADDDPHELDMSMNDSFDSQGSLHLSDLDNSVSNNTSGYTTSPDESFVNSGQNYNYNSDISTNNSQDSLNLSDLDDNNDEPDDFGGKKRRKSLKNKKNKKHVRKTRKQRSGRKQRGGMCFGNGVGANSYDPNFSIYNTRQLELFPYKPK